MALNVVSSDRLSTNVKTSNLATGLSGKVGSSKNLVINGSMKIAQRGDTTGVEYGYGGCDRWRFSGGSAARVTMARQGTASAPTDKGFGFCQRLDVTTADASLAAGDYNMLSYKWEGQNLQQIKKGTSAAESLTVSFWVSSPKTGTHILELYDQTNSRQISKAYTVSSADTWEKKTVTFAGDTTGTITNDAAARLTLEFWLCAGSTYSSGTLNTSWATLNNANRAVGQVNCMDNTSNNFLLTGVQVEIGEVATEFEHVSYEDDLNRCRRYFWQAIKWSGSNNKGLGIGYMHGSSEVRCVVPFPVEMRAEPTIVSNDDSGSWYFNTGSGSADVFNDWTLYSASTQFAVVRNTTDMSGTTAQAGLCAVELNSASLAFNAEL